jgi:hypothetical protein
MFSKLTVAELYTLINVIHAAREGIFVATWPIGSKAVYSAMGMDMSLLLEELNGERASRLWKDR